MQALEFFAVLALAHSFVSQCVGDESEDPIREGVGSALGSESEWPGFSMSQD
jgi:hypothetical protein